LKRTIFKAALLDERVYFFGGMGNVVNEDLLDEAQLPTNSLLMCDTLQYPLKARHTHTHTHLVLSAN
jgi:hypothetical protein